MIATENRLKKICRFGPEQNIFLTKYASPAITKNEVERISFYYERNETNRMDVNQEEASSSFTIGTAHSKRQINSL
jgi:hypothetical protein